MDENTNVDVTQQTTEEVVTNPIDNSSQEEHDTQSKVNPKEVLRELSKKFSVNLFEDGGLQSLNDKLTTRESELNTEKETRTKLEQDLEAYKTKEQEYQIKLEALSLGFTADNLEEAIALAKVYAKDGNIADGLKKAKEKFGKMFTRDMGTQFNDMEGEKPDVPKTEQEKYLAKSKAYQMYNKQKK